MSPWRNNEIVMGKIFTILAITIAWSACHVVKESVKLAQHSDKVYRLASQVNGSDTIQESYFLYNYLEFSDPDIQEFVMQKIVLDSGMHSVDEMGKAFIKNFEQYARSSPHVNPWFEERNLTVRTQTPAYISFQEDWSNYTGGAHGMYSTIFFNYNVREKQEVYLHDLIEPTRRNEVTRLAEELFRRQENLSPEARLDSGYFFENGQFYLNDNYTFTPNGLLFLYNIYEIKPYVSGQTELLIPYRALNPFLNEKGRKFVSDIQQ